jgi:PAS domain S-box-containing protein
MRPPCSSWPTSAEPIDPLRLRCPLDFRLVFHHSLSDSFEYSKVLLASADFEGKLQLLTSGWERALGYSRDEFSGKTLLQLMWCDGPGVATAVAAILDKLTEEPVNLTLRRRDGLGKRFRLHRHYDPQENMMYLLAEETS